MLHGLFVVFCFSVHLCFFFLMIRRPPSSTLFPHPPLFRSRAPAGPGPSPATRPLRSRARGPLCNATTTPVTTAATAHVTRTWVETGIKRPSVAKNQTRGARPRKVANRYFRIGYREIGARTDTIQYGIGLQAHNQTAKKGLRWNNTSVFRTTQEFRAGSRRGCRITAPYKW